MPLDAKTIELLVLARNTLMDVYVNTAGHMPIPIMEEVQECIDKLKKEIDELK
jgi:pyruvate-formate lyase-activating enzyme